MIQTLYKKSKNGIMRWSISGSPGLLTIAWGLSSGKTQVKYEKIQTNQSGRDLIDQTKLRYHARINHQIDLGYKYSVESAIQYEGTDAENKIKPMLAHPYDAQKHCYDSTIQYKYDGHRCIIQITEDGPVAYSRNGKHISTIQHIFNSLSQVPVGTILDGELYVHDTPLQTIASWVKKEQPENKYLEYVVYDTVSKEKFFDRYEEISSLSLGESVSIAPLIENYPAKSDLNNDFIQTAKDKGYEGFILRQNSEGYEIGKRSYQLLKLKSRLDNDYIVADITESVDGWAILHLEVNDRQFKVVAPGTVQNKIDIYKNRHDYVGKLINVEYASKTIEGVPFHPVAIRFIEKC